METIQLFLFFKGLWDLVVCHGKRYFANNVDVNLCFVKVKSPNPEQGSLQVDLLFMAL